MGLPEISEHEARNLEMIFQHTTDKQLIRELVRRGRLHVVDCNQVYFTELANDDSYMTGIDQDIGRTLARHIIDKGHVRLEDHPLGAPFDGLEHAAKTVREGTIVVLRERGAKVEDDG